MVPCTVDSTLSHMVGITDALFGQAPDDTATPHQHQQPARHGTAHPGDLTRGLDWIGLDLWRCPHARNKKVVACWCVQVERCTTRLRPHPCTCTRTLRMSVSAGCDGRTDGRRRTTPTTKHLLRARKDGLHTPVQQCRRWCQKSKLIKSRTGPYRERKRTKTNNSRHP